MNIQKEWFNPKKDFLNYGKRLKNTYRYFGYFIATKLIDSFKQDAKNFNEFKNLPIHIYEINDIHQGLCGFLPGQFTAFVNLDDTKEAGENKDGIKTIMLVNFGTIIAYFYQQFIWLKNLDIDIQDYVNCTKDLLNKNPLDPKDINASSPHIQYIPYIQNLIYDFHHMVTSSFMKCVYDIHMNKDKIEEYYGITLLDRYLPPMPPKPDFMKEEEKQVEKSDLIKFTESMLDDIQNSLEDQNDIVE